MVCLPWKTWSRFVQSVKKVNGYDYSKLFSTLLWNYTNRCDVGISNKSCFGQIFGIPKIVKSREISDIQKVFELTAVFVEIFTFFSSKSHQGNEELFFVLTTCPGGRVPDYTFLNASIYVSRHVASRWWFRHRIGRHRRGTSRWVTCVPGNQPSLETFMSICRSTFTLADSTRSSRHPYSRLSDSPTSRVVNYTPAVLLRLTGFMGTPSITDTELNYRKAGDPCWLLSPNSLYEWDHECVVGEEPMCVRCHGTYTSATLSSKCLHCYESWLSVFRCTWIRSDSRTPEWPKFGPTTIPNSCGHDTGGGLCVMNSRSDDHSTVERIHVLSRVVTHLNSEFCIPFVLGVWFWFK
jgi:hypothetical protein